jgi:uncharacterized protein YihD (DUF1040 family)
MRDPERIPVVLDELRKAWEKNPDLRLCQLIVNLAKPPHPTPEIFYLEDDVLLSRLKNY